MCFKPNVTRRIGELMKVAPWTELDLFCDEIKSNVNMINNIMTNNNDN